MTRHWTNSISTLASWLALGFAGCTTKGCHHDSSVTAPAPSIVSGTTDEALHARLMAALEAKGADYRPRTRHVNGDGSPMYINRLILESSPYLLQHAHNPVDWFPWGDEAFDRARALHRPMFLSVGYSTCHWCHVMEEESFEDEDIARYINEHYIAIKVDREERPDVDAVYMAFVQSFTGRGGWPMSVWMTPDRDPFFGGTYFPPRAGVRGSRRGLVEVMTEQSKRFTVDPAAVLAEARAQVGQLKTMTAPDPPGDFPEANVIRAARTEAGQRFDPAYGGTRGAPKFPSTFPVRTLLRVARRERDPEAKRMALESLSHMRQGGIRDQLGGGFHRYSTDAGWRVPHFEKMLYDNALLAVAYLEGWQASGDTRLRDTTREILEYLLREMCAPDGTFYSATDADSITSSGHHEEGAFFTWTPAELRTALGDDDARVAASWFDVTEKGNLDGRSVLSSERPIADVAKEVGRSPAALTVRLETIRVRLLETRAKRPPPLRDDKVVVSWNGLVVSALARAAIALGEPRYANAATRAARLLMSAGTEGRVPHVLANGVAQGRGFSDDHVLVAAALLDVFELTSDVTYLSRAMAIMDSVESRFSDTKNGGYFLADPDHEHLLVNEKPSRDGPIPSVGSVAALTWLRLFTLTGDDRYRVRAETTVRAFSRSLEAHPLSLTDMLAALDWALDAPKEIVVVVPEGHGALTATARPFLDVLGRSFVPNAVTIVATESQIEHELAKRLPWIDGKKMRSGAATAYVCEGGACKLPTTDPEVFASQISEARPYP